MSQTTGPLLTAGALTWANQTILADSPDSVAETTVRIGVATGLLAGLFYGLERIQPDIATALAYTILVTSLVVRFNNKPTPLERLFDLVA